MRQTWPRASMTPLGAMTLSCAAAVIFATVEQAQAYISGERGFGFFGGLLRMQRPWLILGLMAPIALAAARRFPLSDTRWMRALPVHVAASFAFAYAHLFLLAATDRVLLHSSAPIAGETLELARLYLIQNLFIYWTIVGASHAWLLHRSLQRRDLDAAELRSLLSDARFEALQHRIQPHFLFNTLNTVVMLARGGDHRAVVRVLTDLSGLLRHSLRESSPDGSVLREEIEFLERYVAIEQLRFGGRLRVEYHIEPGAESATLPSLILQPLVENAVRHGLARIAARAEITVRCVRDGAQLVIDVEDNGSGITRVWDRATGALGEAGAAGPGTGIGLRNVAERLDALYGAAGTLAVVPRNGQGTRARISIPFRVAAEHSFTAPGAVAL